jgi:hypothetical protein
MQTSAGCWCELNGVVCDVQPKICLHSGSSERGVGTDIHRVCVCSVRLSPTQSCTWV